AVLRYAVTYAAEVAARPGVAGIELEACGWYGFDHLSAHDKSGWAAAAGEYLMSLCFCGACQVAYRRAGVHPEELALRGREALDAGDPPDPGLAGAVATVRDAVADRLRGQVVAAVRRAAPAAAVALHASPRPRQSTAFTGVTVKVAGALVDRLV